MSRLTCDRNFSLKNLKFHEDMSEETGCFSADLYEDGKLLAHVKNSGHGGCNDYTPAKGKTWKDIQGLNQIDTDCYIMQLAEELNIVKKNQSNKLVLLSEKDGKIYTLKYKHSFAKMRKSWGEEKFKTLIGEQVKKQEAEGFKVLNTNLNL